LRAASLEGNGHLIPEPVKRPSQSDDVEADTWGRIYVIDRLAGFDILEFDGAR